MENQQSKDVGLNANLRPGSLDVRGFQPDLFPFDAFEFDDPNREVAPKLRMSSPWAIAVGSGNLDPNITPNVSFQSDPFTPGVEGWAIYENGDVEFNDGVFRGDLEAASMTASTIDGTDITAGTITGTTITGAEGSLGGYNSYRKSQTYTFTAGTTLGTVYDTIQPFLEINQYASIGGDYGSAGLLRLFYDGGTITLNYGNKDTGAISGSLVFNTGAPGTLAFDLEIGIYYQAYITGDALIYGRLRPYQGIAQRPFGTVSGNNPMADETDVWENIRDLCKDLSPTEKVPVGVELSTGDVFPGYMWYDTGTSTGYLTYNGSTSTFIFIDINIPPTNIRFIYM